MKRIFNGSGGRKAALILSLCLIFALAVGTTVALLKANTDPVTNTFTAAESKITIEENTDNGSKSEIYVKNEGTATSYVRVKLVMNWVDDKENVVSGDNLPKVSLKEGSDWFLGTDGIYYYTKPVAPNGGTTSNLLENNPIKEPTTEEGKPAGCHLEVTVLAESIQAAPDTAVKDAWKVVEVDSGVLTPATP
ncbi:MAG: hypothetical protein MR552_00100 [Clostridiales bacterium]|nr:hypothetical protein [Clostridiales bacterium]